MNRNKFVLQVALALVLILIAAVAGQFRKWQQWRSSIRIMPPASEPYVVFDQKEVREPGEISRPEILVKFHAGVSEETKNTIASRLNDRIEDEIESVIGLAAIDDLDDAEAESVASEYRGLPEVEYAEPSYEISLDHDWRIQAPPSK